uniref:Uncharacterized protein n=1 Tax=Arundo donax TaxID=35708 RepID=A0A0A9ABI5_ARUDO
MLVLYKSRYCNSTNELIPEGNSLIEVWDRSNTLRDGMNWKKPSHILSSAGLPCSIKVFSKGQLGLSYSSRMLFRMNEILSASLHFSASGASFSITPARTSHFVSFVPNSDAIHKAMARTMGCILI